MGGNLPASAARSIGSSGRPTSCPHDHLVATLSLADTDPPSSPSTPSSSAGAQPRRRRPATGHRLPRKAVVHLRRRSPTSSATGPAARSARRRGAGRQGHARWSSPGSATARRAARPRRTPRCGRPPAPPCAASAASAASRSRCRRPTVATLSAVADGALRRRPTPSPRALRSAARRGTGYSQRQGRDGKARSRRAGRLGPGQGTARQAELSRAPPWSAPRSRRTRDWVNLPAERPAAPPSFADEVEARRRRARPVRSRCSTRRRSQGRLRRHPRRRPGLGAPAAARDASRTRPAAPNARWRWSARASRSTPAASRSSRPGHVGDEVRHGRRGRRGRDHARDRRAQAAGGGHRLHRHGGEHAVAARRTGPAT